jgi:hypothetical protein
VFLLKAAERNNFGCFKISREEFMRRRNSNRSSGFPVVQIVLVTLVLIVGGALLAGGGSQSNPRLAACYVRQYSASAGGVQIKQGSATLFKLEGIPGVYAITAYHVAQAMGGAKNVELYVPGAGGYSVTQPYFDYALDTALFRVEKNAPELEARALTLESLGAYNPCGGTYVAYNDAQPGGALAATERQLAVSAVEPLAGSVKLPVQELIGAVFLQGVTLKEGQSGALLFSGGQPAGLASANAKYNGHKGLILVPFTKIKDSVATYARTEKERQLAIKE